MVSTLNIEGQFRSLQNAHSHMLLQVRQMPRKELPQFPKKTEFLLFASLSLLFSSIPLSIPLSLFLSLSLLLSLYFLFLFHVAVYSPLSVSDVILLTSVPQRS